MAIAFMEVSAVFDLVPHSQLHRKIQGAFKTEALESLGWLDVGQSQKLRPDTKPKARRE